MRRFMRFRETILRHRTLFVLLTLTIVSVLVLSGTPRSSSSGTPKTLKVRNAKSSANRITFHRPPQTGCCDGEESEQKPHLLAGSYYRVTDGFSARLLLNNKGPAPIDVQPTLFSLNGQRFDLPTVTAEANNHRFIDFRDWVDLAGPQFSEGSLQVFHRGKDLVLGVQIYLTDEIHSLSFEEKLVELGQGATRLEGVWWLPSPRGEVSLVVSNTSDAGLCAVTRVQGESPRKEASLAIELAPHETRVVDIKTGILQREHGAMSQFGSISIEHNGTAGAVLARAMASENIVGYSLPVQFSNPAGAKSNNLQGAGLRLSDVRGDRLSAKLVLHNASAAEMIVNGRVPYATTDGVTGELYLPQQQLSAAEIKVIDVSQLLTIQGVHPNGVSSAGLELQHTGDFGALITTSFSVSESGNQVFRMPIWDVAAQRSATGGYPWYVEGDSSTVVYIKNTTDQQRQFRLYLMYEGGSYLYPLTAVAPHQTHTIDIRSLRDDQVPAADGNTIPLATNRGQVQWSMTGGEDRVLIGRSEQADLVKRISSNYSCINCCGNSFYDGWVTPGPTVGFVGEEIEITAMQQDMNCYGQTFSPFPALATFSAAAPSICDPSSGSTILFAPGQTSLYGVWRVDSWSPGVGGYCEYSGADILRDAVCNVVASVDKIQYQRGSNFVDIDGTLFVLKGSTVTFKAVAHPSYATFPEGKPIWSGTAGVSGTGQTISYTFNTASTDAQSLTTITATSGNTKSVNVIVFELTPVLTPSDNFPDRSTTHFGIREQLTLGFTVTPSGVTAAQVGGLEWTQTSGSGSLNSNTDGTGTYTVASTAESAELKLKILDGPSKDQGPIKSLTIVAPSGGFVKKPPLGGIRHIQNFWSCGFIGEIFVTPAGVSFWGFPFKEEDVPASANGWLSFLHGQGHCANQVCPPAQIHSGAGRGLVNMEDAIWSGAYQSNQDRGPYANGEVIWNIPWKYAIPGGTWRPLTTVEMKANSTPTGKCFISKGGEGPFSKELGAPSSDW